MNKKWLYAVSALVLGTALVLGFLTGGDIPDEHAGVVDDSWDTPVFDDDASTLAFEDAGEAVLSSAQALSEAPVQEETQVPAQDSDQHRAPAFPSTDHLSPEEIADAGQAMDLQEQMIMNEVQRLEAERADLQASGVVEEVAPPSEAELEAQRLELEQVMLEEMRRLEQGEHFIDNAMPDDVPLPPQLAE